MQVSKEIVERLSRYRSVLLRLRGLGFVKVFSDNLGDALGMSASQVRKDFSAFGLRGVKRGGYDVESLLSRLDELLGATEVLRVVVIGCGNVGRALLQTYGRSRDGICAVAGFDVDSQIVDPEADLPIYDVQNVVEYIDKEKIKVAILSVPEQAAMEEMQRLCQSSVEGVLNFTTAQLRSCEQLLVHNIDIRMEIEKLFYRVNFNKHGLALVDADKSDKGAK